MSGTATSAAEQAAIAAQTGANASKPYAPNTPNSTTNAAQIPTKAPSVSPTAINSSNSATNLINSQIVPTMTGASSDLASHNLKLSQGQQFDGGTVNYDFNTGKKLQPGQTTQVNQPNGAATPPVPTNDTATQPPSDGYQATWDAQGNRSDIPVGSAPAAGYTTTKPNNPVINGVQATNTYENDDGSKLVQFADGTYGRLDAQGNFAGALSGADFSSQVQGTATYQQQQYIAAMKDLQTKMLSITTGSFPLNASQQAIITGITNQLGQDVAAQTTANTNYTGGVTTAQNLYGMGNTTIGLGEIQKSVTDGVTAIANLQTKAAASVASMTDAFQKENYSELKDQYDEYNTAQQGIQDHIDKINAAIVAKQESDRAYAADQQKTYYAEVTQPIQSIADEAAKNGADKKTIAAISGATDVASAITAAGDSLQTATGQLGDYLQYKRDASANGQNYTDYATWKAADDAKQEQLKVKEAYGTAFATAKGKAAGEAAANPNGTGVGSPVIAPSGITYNAPADIAPYVGFSANGVKYVDLSNFKGTPTEANQAVADAQAAGYKVITNKNSAADVQNITDAKAKLADMQNAFDNSNSGNAAERDSYAGAFMKMGKILQTNPDAVGTDIYQDTALDILKAMSGTQGFRGGQSIIENVKSTFPNTGDTRDVIDAKMKNINKLIDDREVALVGKPSASDQLLINENNAKNSVNDYVANSSPENQQSVAKLFTLPTATNQSVLSYMKLHPEIYGPIN